MQGWEAGYKMLLALRILELVVIMVEEPMVCWMD